MPSNRQRQELQNYRKNVENAYDEERKRKNNTDGRGWSLSGLGIWFSHLDVRTWAQINRQKRIQRSSTVPDGTAKSKVSDKDV